MVYANHTGVLFNVKHIAEDIMAHVAIFYGAHKHPFLFYKMGVPPSIQIVREVSGR